MATDPVTGFPTKRTTSLSEIKAAVDEARAQGVQDDSGTGGGGGGGSGGVADTVKVSSLPLPPGASRDATVAQMRDLVATAAKQDSANDTLGRILSAFGSLASDASISSLITKVDGLLTASASPALPEGAASDSSLQAIKTVLQAQVDLANLMVTDGTRYFVRREVINDATQDVTVSFTTLAGDPANPDPALLAPVLSGGSGGSSGGGGAASTRVIETVLYDVVTAETGTSIGDIIARVLVYDTAANAIVASYWHNLTTGATLANAPTQSAIVEQARALPVDAATGTKQDAQSVVLTSIFNALKPLATETSLVAVTTKLEAMRALLAAPVLPADAATATGVAAVLAQLKTTLAVSVSTLPLPNGAATETTGAAILAQLKTTLKISADALPLPAGASTEATLANVLAAVRALQTGADGIALTPADGADIGTTIRSIYIGTAGDLTVRGPSGTSVTFKNAVAGSTINIAAKRVMSTGTTAANLIGLL